MQSYIVRSRREFGFTLIELLIVVAIIAILAAIAVPNFLEAQTRSKTARVRSDLRTLAAGLESYRIDHNRYPEGTDIIENIDPRFGPLLGPLSYAYYTIRTRTGTTQAAGRDFCTLTTPIAYVNEFYVDPFVADGKSFFTYCYRAAKASGSGYVLTSVGPDSDLFESRGGRLGVGSSSLSPVSTLMDPSTPARLGDLNERSIIHYFETTDMTLVEGVKAWGGMDRALADVAYDPSNGSTSDGDIYRVGP